MGFLTKDTEVVTKAELAEFYTKIYPWLGTNNPSTTGAIDKAYMFSTDEKLIGQWIDGKPLYQKVVQLNPVTASSASVSTPHGISNLGDVVELRGIWHNNHQWFMTLPRAESTISGAKATNTIDMYAGPEYIMLTVGKAFGTMTGAWAIIRYTKSTDTVVSIGNENNYSTGETIVGTWIDGKPLYQKTISCGALPNKTSKNIAHGIDNIAIVVDVFGNTKTLISGTLTTFNLPLVHSSGTCSCYVNGAYITLEATNDYHVYDTTYVTIKYTKTTD